MRVALAQVLKGLGPLGLNKDDIDNVELVLAEALNNIVEHAYAPDDAAGRITIKCMHQDNGLHLEIEDEGARMPDGLPPTGSGQDLCLAVEDLPEGGFGWFLIRSLATDVTYARVGAANRLRLRLAVGVSDQTP